MKKKTRQNVLIIMIIVLVIIVLFVIKGDFKSLYVLFWNFLFFSIVIWFIYRINLAAKKRREMKTETFKTIAREFNTDLVVKSEDFLDKRKESNPNKHFIPHNAGKIPDYSFSGKFKDKDFWFFVLSAREVQPKMKGFTREIIEFVVIEMSLRTMPTYLSLVKEEHEWGPYSSYTAALQKLMPGRIHFDDINFESKTFNKKWEVFGYDKKFAYQIFDPALLHLLNGVDDKQLIGIEMSDNSIWLVRRAMFPYNVEQIKNDFELVSQIVRQIERNYRG